MSADTLRIARSRDWLTTPESPGRSDASPLTEIARLRRELDAARRRMERGAGARLTNAQEVVRVADALGWSASQLAMRLGVDDDLVAAWARKAAVDDGVRFDGGSRAQHIARIRVACGWTVDEMARLLGVSAAAAERWMRKARADAERRRDSGGREPAADVLARAVELAAGAEPGRDVVLHLRALAVLSVACPDAIPEVQTRARFARAVASVERVRLAFYPDPEIDAVVMDGADVVDEESDSE